MDTTPQVRRRRGGCRRTALITLGAAAALIIVVTVIAVAAGGGGKTAPVSAPSTFAPSSSPQATASTSEPAVPAPDGTFTGSCDYTLGEDPASGTAQAVGDIDATNTGNVGLVVKLTITWPQEGHAPLRMSRTVRLPYGGERDVQFSRSLSYDQIASLQSYQSGHDYQDGCTYHGDMTDTFGPAH